MAESPAHRFGQIIGELLEELLAERLDRFCRQRALFLDKKGPRKGVRSGTKLTWKDRYGNFHDLDYVIEKPAIAGEPIRPIAFVEAAWRRYTKHSRNKVQEISGAVVPICEVYDRDAPFMGAVLAGKFSAPSLEQLRRLGFSVVYLGYDRIIDALGRIGIDARFDEATPDEEFAVCVAQLDALGTERRAELRDAIILSSEEDFAVFFATLEAKLDRHLERVSVLPLFGQGSDFPDVAEALAFVEHLDTTVRSGEFQRFEVSLQFSNGDHIRASLAHAQDVRAFLDYAVR